MDSGELLSSQQLTDTLGFANNILDSWTNEETLSLQMLAKEQAAALQILIDQQTRTFLPVSTGYTLSDGTYTAAMFTPSSFTPGGVLQFANTAASITAPAGYARALALALAVEMAPYWQTAASADLVRQLAEARAAASPVPQKLPIPGTSGQGTIPRPNDAQSPEGEGA
ncbi:MAG TPA: hypothetical protein VIY49_29555 [Bryobacteraceae bacterium]